ncbi:hypothetical protein A2631_02105 [Candidatus Daviesbacteria bacterium RIFCSPHIGHO2_01_FULL_44_29]|uniref:PHP domain-containing protein n=1 Tax=Candidatus Daviesbacteria bacterium RIFCSPHIGHO2_02_FULL_43_12 TaxID=1797776 RepID=A0A1F5KK58_9BACT|nr:MAG: hypothetical protein A2631_02105 [Candidatus Daviesbacteria bacterium RIFCSPHIGHO2_01_FULL_44_29]OGE39534.1 MAG: hypothetical protein A3E86_01795 [Candidatus Daviesbacteria bacterium RIFCSPHIGHO2_12_FULL_47_45]OGE41190.1 MAG: hypothetical protein A3D25_01500 [Candidatus Daviesbacteria bacterium RIFCSPHIGHO2_02_FULL_43_12]OGE69389.1 MAG: hypothetical protein A3B55_03240 [Candidatus Daviesbacteria bacterium RIFCSPLOWO2_01_FULL_43_15]
MSERNCSLAGMEVLTHVHVKLGELSFNSSFPEFGRFGQNWQDGQITIRQFAWMLGQLGRHPSVVDSDHTGHSLDEYHPFIYPANSVAEVRAMRSARFVPSRLPQTIDTISQRVDARRAMVEKHRKDTGTQIYTGVEADILSPEGLLDINTGVLRQLQVGGASYHEDEFIDAFGRQATLPEIISAYTAVALNPGVDIINHPIRELSRGAFRALEENPLHFEELFRHIARENKAIEINLRDLIDPERKHQEALMMQLAVMAKNIGVKLTLGTDFHSLQTFMRPELPGGKRQDSEGLVARLYQEFPKGEQLFVSDAQAMVEFEAKMPAILAELFPRGTPLSGQGLGTPSNLLKIYRPAHRAISRLAAAGIQITDFINSNQIGFDKWQSERFLIKQATLS